MVRHPYLSAAALALSASCAFFAPRFEVAQWSPTAARIDDPACIELWLRFSGPANKSSVERAFSLSRDGELIGGSFEWDGGRMRFSPQEGFEANRRYKAALTTGAENEKGVSLDREFDISFSTKAEEGRPVIVSVLPAEGAAVDNRYSAITMSFSESVDRASLYAAFSLSPSLQGRFDWLAGDSVCVFAPLEPYSWQTEYRISIRSDLADLSANTIAKPFASRFTVGTDSAVPELVRASNALSGIEGSVVLNPSPPGETRQAFTSAWESTWGLFLTFSESVERDSLESRILIEPACGYAIDATAAFATSFVLKPQERLARETLYSVTIRKGVKDAQGNGTSAEAVYKFRVDGPITASPVVTLLRFRSNPAALPADAAYDEKRCDHSDDYSAMNVSSAVFPAGGTAVDTYVDLYLELADGAFPDLFSLMQAFSIEASNSCASFFVNKIQDAGFADPQPEAIAGSVCARITFSLANAGNSGIVTFKIADDLVDSAGNPIGGAWRLPLLK